MCYDLGTGCLAAYPVKNKSAQETAKRLTHFRGKDTVKFFFSDKHRSLVAAVEQIGNNTIPTRLPRQVSTKPTASSSPR